MRNKILPSIASIMCAIMILCTPMQCLAVEVTETGTKDVPVTASINPTFTVSLPPNLELVKSGSTATCRSQVGVKGDIEVSGAVKVKPDRNFAMYDVTLRPAEDTLTPDNESAQTYPHKTPIAANTSQTKKTWDYSELSSQSSSEGFTYDADSGYHNTDLTITVNGFTSGKWEGLLNFAIEYNPNCMKPGLYDANGTKLVSWEDSGIDIVADHYQNTYMESSNSAYKRIKSNYPTATVAVVPDSVTSLGECAFAGCDNLTSIVLPDSVTSIDHRAFDSCTGLNSIDIPNSVTSIGYYAFACSGLTEITIPDSVTSFSYCVFLGCSSLESAILPESFTDIAMGTFQDCSSLKSVNILNSVTSIGSTAFGGCDSLESITINKNVTSIGSGAFQDCTNLTSVVFENTSGWVASDPMGFESSKTLDSSSLANAYTAATYLTSTYKSYDWNRN